MTQKSRSDTLKGFPPNTRYISLPAPFFTAILPEIEEIEELKVTLALFYLMAEKRGSSRSISREELTGSGLLKNMTPGQLKNGLIKAVERGTFLPFSFEKNGKQHNLYFLNAEPEKKALEKFRNGELSTGSLEEKAFVKTDKNIFTLYEDSIGQVNPLLVEELAEAEKLYSFQWIEEAFKEAVSLNKRSWRYISRILERWAEEGKSGETGRYPSKRPEPQDYFKGRYGHIVHGQKR